MYALKLITVTFDGRQVETSHILGKWYRLEMPPEGVPVDVIARVEYSNDVGDIPCFDICRTDEAYITLLTGETVRHVVRGDAQKRSELAAKLKKEVESQPQPKSSIPALSR
ncbi:hypothetical protein [Lelliottia wanjuensis]|uniref:Uncharacterized protein n=1 Tax=Lelliottia wanjuensis TaxID=3050585 RepID=A0AAP4D8X5_9ENTR|nr:MULTISPECIES: hypothetical protein [unclassified Lelliottia]MDK9364183.1 hypothetical protein [Lelliottia sp. V106_12]MDK9617140.1 hypothetical protein [Lelliottia sp. V106_9]